MFHYVLFTYCWIYVQIGSILYKKQYTADTILNAGDEVEELFYYYIE